MCSCGANLVPRTFPWLGGGAGCLANEACSIELTIIISYPTSVSAIINLKVRFAVEVIL